MLRVRTVMTGVAGSPWYSNLFFEGTDSTQAQAAVDAVRAFWVRVGVLMAPSVVITVEAFVPNITPIDGQILGGFTTNPGAPIASSGAGSPVPPVCQVLVSLLTPAYAGGRAIRGKFNLPYLTEEHNVGGGVVDLATRSLMISAFGDLIAAGPELVVWSRKNGNAAPVTSVLCGENFAVLRSRRD